MRRSIIVVKMPLLIFVVVFQARMSLAGDTPAPQPGAATFFGEVRPMGNGMAWSWVRHDAKNIPTALGITFTETALLGLPENPPANGLYGWEYALTLPKQAAATSFTHVGWSGILTDISHRAFTICPISIFIFI